MAVPDGESIFREEGVAGVALIVLEYLDALLVVDGVGHLFALCRTSRSMLICLDHHLISLWLKVPSKRMSGSQTLN